MSKPPRLQYLVITRGTVDDLPIAVVDSYAEAERLALGLEPEQLAALPAAQVLLGSVHPGPVNYVDIVQLKRGIPAARLLHRRVEK